MLAWLIISICVFTILLGLFIYGAIIFNKSNGWEGEDCMLFSGVLGFFSLASLVASLCFYPKYIESYNIHITDIMSISRESSVEGRFTLGCGYVKEVSYYFYYYETPKGIKLGKISSENTYIIETDEYVPSIYEVKEYQTLSSYYNLYVPYGTVVTNYILN